MATRHEWYYFEDNPGVCYSLPSGFEMMMHKPDNAPKFYSLHLQDECNTVAPIATGTIDHCEEIADKMVYG